ncbi:MAG: RelA/SpoT family protein [Chitinivibrionales bacterium]|nr:RelA/SpoT family protein [Chitinivibrionales bacterium]MBD3356340.1 RelA/SpoT family protein [Chitinivibrionales bacterium]
MNATTRAVTGTLEESLNEYVQKVRQINPKLPTDLIEKAYRFSWEAHKDQLRKSGEPFLAHPVAVSLILAEQQLDAVSIAAGLLHDVVEDTTVSREKIASEFGEEVAKLVDGVTKIRTLQMKSRQERQAETFRKMLLSMAEDLRVIIIKFADRIHNLRTLKYLKPDKIKAIAAETLDIYAPLAHRLGMARIKWEMEDLAFKHLHPKEHKEIVSKVVASRYEREAIIESFAGPLRKALDREGIPVSIIGRPKHFYSIYRKIRQRDKPFEEIYDLLAIRAITDSISECYAVLGVIHSLWKPIQDRFKDYIAVPKSNGYQSLHTTVVGDDGCIIEIQIRTWEMNQVAEDGIAAHWLYKSDDNDTRISPEDRTLVWLKNLIEWQKDLTDSTEFLEFFKVDLFHAEIFVFTPKGDLISLPKGATVLDFAFAVHTDLGLHCIGARVDGKMEPINRVLGSGSTVEILHLASKKPSIEWLREVKTPKARSAIRRWLKNTGRQESIDLGKRIIKSQLEKRRLVSTFNENIADILQFLGLTSPDRLYELVGNGELPVGKVMQFFEVRQVPQSVGSRISRFVDSFTGRNSEILIGAGDDLMVRFARCCNPIPGDPIIGFVTKGRGISVHRSDCAHVGLFQRNGERTIQVRWDDHHRKPYTVFLEVIAGDRPGLLHDIAAVFSDTRVNILEGTIRTNHHRVRNIFRIELNNSSQLKEILRRIRRIPDVESVVRTRDTDEIAE